MSNEDKRVFLYDKGNVIFREGAEELWMFEIVTGSVGVYLNYGSGNEKKLTVLEAGSFVGEMGLLGEPGSMYASPRSATAVAEADGTTLKRISHEDFSEYFQEEPEKVFRMMQQMSRRLRDLTNDYAGACDTIREMKASETEEEIPNRKPSLLERIAAYSVIYPIAWY